MITLDICLIFIPQIFFNKRIFFYKTITEEINRRKTIYSLFEIHKEMISSKKFSKNFKKILVC
jgi:hypothetical protein